ncbi:MAG: hypothetical protein ACLP9Y_10045 [Mycobacterium sp.]
MCARAAPVRSDAWKAHGGALDHRVHDCDGSIGDEEVTEGLLDVADLAVIG